MPHPPRRYLDNAATSWPKPESVHAAWERAARSLGVAAGRGAYREAVDTQFFIDRGRRLVADLLGGVDPGRVAFSAGTVIAPSAADADALATAAYVLGREGIPIIAPPGSGTGVILAAATAEGGLRVSIAHRHAATVSVEPEPALEVEWINSAEGNPAAP